MSRDAKQLLYNCKTQSRFTFVERSVSSSSNSDPTGGKARRVFHGPSFAHFIAQSHSEHDQEQQNKLMSENACLDAGHEGVPYFEGDACAGLERKGN